MKTTITVFFITLFLLACSENQSVNNDESNKTSSRGQVSLSFDKNSIPASVHMIVCILSRNGYSTINRSINVLSDSSAVVFVDSIATGTWTLQINALGETENILYTGQTSVTIVDGTITEVSIMLNPVGTGMGSVRITITWGTKNISWTDYSFNAILHRQNTANDTRGIGYPIVLKDDSLYKMWYLNLRSFPDTAGWTSVGYATSADGLTWQHYSPQPVMFPTPGSWDSRLIGTGTVIKDNGLYKMYYYGYDESQQYHIGMAVSTDGLHWEKRSQPILRGTMSGNEYSVGVLGVLKTNGTYKMYYHTTTASGIYLATSIDGNSWSRHSSNPILTPTESWESSGIAHASVVYDNGIYRMVYANNSYSHSFGMATSYDGISWKKSAANPFFNISDVSTSWAPASIGYPFFVKAGNSFRIYYTGFTGSGYEAEIGVILSH